MAFRDALDLADYWKDFPPLHILIRPFFRSDTKKPAGAERRNQPTRERQEMDQSDMILARRMSQTPRVKGARMPGWAKELMNDARQKMKERENRGR